MKATLRAPGLSALLDAPAGLGGGKGLTTVGIEILSVRPAPEHKGFRLDVSLEDGEPLRLEPVVELLRVVEPLLEGGR